MAKRAETRTLIDELIAEAGPARQHFQRMITTSHQRGLLAMSVTSSARSVR
jgi:hypothetical protein